MRNYICFQYSDLSGGFFTFQQDNAPCLQGAWDRAAVNVWNTRLHRSSSVASQQSWPEPSKFGDLGHVAGTCISQLDSWHWPAEVTPDRRVRTFSLDVHRWRDQAVASKSSSLHSSTWRTFWTQTLVMFDVCIETTDIHFHSHMSVRLPTVDTIVLGWPH